MNTKKKPSADAFSNLIKAARGNPPTTKPPAIPEQTDTAESSDRGTTEILPIASIQVKVRFKQPRHYFDADKLRELENSIRSKGIEEPLVVRPISAKTYELVDGERRYRAAKAVGLTEVPVSIRAMDDRQALEYSLTKFLLSEELNPVEQTQGILDLLSLELDQSIAEVTSRLYRMQNQAKGKVASSVTRNVAGNSEKEGDKDNDRQIIEQLFAAIGMSWESFIRHRLPLLNLPPDILDALQQGKLAYTKAQAIARLKDDDQRRKLLQTTITQNLSLAEIKEQLAEIKSSPTIAPPADQPPPIRNRIDAALRQVKRSKALDDPKKQRKIERLLTQLEAIVAEE
jgi:ParB family transcriptional regulator, chromosome partitioning protein